MSHHRKLLVVTAFALAAVAAHAFLGCSPEHISDTATVTLRFNPDDSGVGGFQCVQPRSTPVCDALRACEEVGDVRSCFVAACRNRACDPSLLSCLGSANDGGASSRKAISTCLQNACATPVLASAPKMAVVVDFLRLDGFPSWGARLLRSEKVAEAREAATRFEQYLKAHPDSGRAWSNLGFVNLSAEEPREAARAFGKALELGYRKAPTMYNLACAHAQLKEKDEAFAWLDRAIDAGYADAGHMEDDDDLWNLRRDPRFRKAVEKARRAEEREGD